MMNSMTVSNNHYSLALQSMIDMAIESQRYEEEARVHRANLVNYHQSPFPGGPPPPSYPQLEGKHQSRQSQHAENSIGVRMSDDSLGGGPSQEEREMRLLYPRSPQSPQSDQKSHDSMSPPISISGSNLSENNRDKGNSAEMYTKVLSQLRSNCGVNYKVNHSVSESTGSEGQADKSMGTKQGAGEGNIKPSFSIEALLAHSNSLRRHPHGQEVKCREKDNRFAPYVVPQSSRSVARSETKPMSQSEEKRSETYGASNKQSARRAAKSKRVRTIFTPEQLERLEMEFEKQQYMVGSERLYLASSLYLTEAQVKVWFQNRRIKWRKQHLEMEQQKLKIYRSITEQDIMSSMCNDDTIDSDYDDDDGVALDEDPCSSSSSCLGRVTSTKRNPLENIICISTT